MIGIDFLLKRLGLFFVVFLTLTGTSFIPQARTAHDAFFMRVIQPIHNFLNPNVYAEFDRETRQDRKHFGVAISLWDKKIHGNKASRRAYRIQNGPNMIKFPNLRHMIYIPTALLFSLVLITPLHWKKKLLAGLVGFVLLYLVFSLFFHSQGIHIVPQITIA